MEQPKPPRLTLNARHLDITWGEISRYWEWKSEKDGEESFEAAYLKAACWLEVSGRMNIKQLLPNTLYEVVLLMKINGFSYGWRQPVKFSLSFDNESEVDVKLKEREEILYRLTMTRWDSKPIGFFKTKDKVPDMNVHFTVCQRSGYWKRGLAIKGVAIRPATPAQLTRCLPYDKTVKQIKF